MRRGALLLLCLCAGFDWPGKIYRIQHELERAEPERRRELVRELAGQSAQAAKEPLLFALEDADPSVRLEAAAVAGRVRLREAVPLLLDWLLDKEAGTREAAARALGQIREPRALAALVRSLGDSAAEVRRAGVIALDALGGTEVVVPILGRLEDTDLSVRMQAMAALGRLRDARAVVPLLGAAVDPSPDIRSAALAALGALRDGRALATLTRALADDSEDVRLAAAVALGKLADPASVRALGAALGRGEGRLGHAVVWALARIDSDAARALLLAQLRVPGARLLARQALLDHAQVPKAAPAGPAGKDSAALASALAAALRESTGDARIALAETLTQLAAARPIAAAVPVLLELLPASTGEEQAALLGALGASASSEALLPLLEQLEQRTGDALDPVLEALEAYFERADPDGRAADPILGKLVAVTPAQRPRIVALLGKVRAERSAPALAALLTVQDRVLRLAAIAALGELGVVGESRALLALLSDEDAEVRMQAALALRETANASTAAALLTALASQTPQDRHALLVALGGSLGRLARTGALTAELRKHALDTLAVLVTDPDDALSDRAVDALALIGVPEVLEPLTLGLRSPSSRRRAVAALAIGQLEGEPVRRLLRYLLQHGSTREITAASTALAEAGDARELSALIRASKRHHWPVPGAAAYALARLAERGLLRPHAAQRALCALGRSREPYVRANVAAAMAAFAAAPCEDGGPDPLRWLEPEHAAPVRNAAARWARAAASTGRLDATTSTDALAKCAERDVDPAVRSACAGAEPTSRRGTAELYGYDRDATTLLRNRLVALRRSSGAVLLARTDANGHLRLKGESAGELSLENPGLVPLEPPE